jgi:hypothetical protein
MFDALTDQQRHVLLVALKSHRVYVGDYLARLRGRPGPVSEAELEALEQMLAALEPSDEAMDTGDDLV